MARSWILCCVFLFLTFGKINAEGGPPKVTGSYKASGEMVETVEDDQKQNQDYDLDDDPNEKFKLLVQIAFEESYNAETKDAAFNIWIMGKNVTYVENYEANQTYKYVDGTECTLMTPSEWIKTKSPPTLLDYEDTNGTVRFSLKQLFSLDESFLKEKNVSATFRELPARKWMYEIRGTEPDTGDNRVLSIYAYWSDGSWTTTSNEPQVPLGYIITKTSYKRGEGKMKVHEQFINVFSFVPGAIDHKLFKPVQGVVCEGRKSLVKFPDVNNMQALAFHSEVIFPDYQEIKYVDTWFDPRNKLMRQDMERIKNEVPIGMRQSRKFQSEMVLGKLGIVFRLGYFEGKVSCSVVSIKDFDLDIQNLINFKLDLKDWSIGKMFGLNQTQYTYIGKTSKRDIPCHLFQGKRTDWPEPSANVESLWEWCFSTNVTTKDDTVIFRNGEYGLVNAQVNVTKSGKPADIPVGYRIYHHFYDVNLMDPVLMDETYFHVENCFEDSEKRRLQFIVDWRITDDNIHLVENSTSDVNFLQQWKVALYIHSGIDPNTLRITAVNPVIIDKTLYVKLTILSVHADLSEAIKKTQPSPLQAEENLRKAIDEDLISVSYIPSKNAKPIKIGAVKSSLSFQIKGEFNKHTTTTTLTEKPSSTTKKIPFTLITDPDDDKETSSATPEVSVTQSGSTTTPNKNTSPGGKTSKSSTPTGGSSTSTAGPTSDTLKDPKKTLHKGGTVAAVSIAMLLVGVTIGATGIFVKFNGMPPCLKCVGAQRA